jgi:hypothetical protein
LAVDQDHFVPALEVAVQRLWGAKSLSGRKSHGGGEVAIERLQEKGPLTDEGAFDLRFS